MYCALSLMFMKYHVLLLYWKYNISISNYPSSISAFLQPNSLVFFFLMFSYLVIYRTLKFFQSYDPYFIDNFGAS